MSKTLKYPKVAGEYAPSSKVSLPRFIVCSKATILLNKSVAEVSRREGHLAARTAQSRSLTFPLPHRLSQCCRVFRAVHFEEHRVAACKVVALAPETKPYDRKMIEKEMQVHSALKHPHVLEFINAVIVEPNGRSRYHSGIYMLLELAAAGDLFDKIGTPPLRTSSPEIYQQRQLRTLV